MLHRLPHRLRFAVALFAASALCAMAHAADVAGVRLDDRATVGGQELVLNGAGVRTKMMFKVYVASLYLRQKGADLAATLASTPRRVQLNLMRDLSANQLVDALVDGLNESNSPEQVAAVKPQTEQLAGIMKAFGEVKEKDVVTLDFIDGATRVALNGQSKGSIPGEAFNQALMRVWLGDKAVQPDLRKAMLGG
jgi:long-chain acyl-CoA synthetase